MSGSAVPLLRTGIHAELPTSNYQMAFAFSFFSLRRLSWLVLFVLRVCYSLTEQEVWQVLAVPLPELAYAKKMTTGHTSRASNSRTPLRVLSWQLDVTEPAVLKEAVCASVEFTKAIVNAKVCSEVGGIQVALRFLVLTPLVDALSKTLQLTIETELDVVRGNPDHAVGLATSSPSSSSSSFSTTKASNSPLLLVIEDKTPWKFKPPSDDLVAIYNGSKCPDHIRSAVRQVYGYMCVNHLVYGALSTYNKTWFMRRNAEGHLFISRCFLFTETSPSVLQAFAHVVALACDVASCDSPPSSPESHSNPRGKRRAADDEEEDIDPGQKRKRPEGRAEHGASKQAKASSNAKTQPRTSKRNAGACRPCNVGDGAAVLLITQLPFLRFVAEGRTGKAYATVVDGTNAVVKVADVSKQPEMREELDLEAAVYARLASLQGRCVPRLLFVGHLWEGLLYGLATEAAGESLAMVGLENLASSDKEAAMASLAAVHECGVLHNDIRLENIVRAPLRPRPLRSLPRVLLIDFACSRLMGSGEAARKAMGQEKKKLRSLLFGSASEQEQLCDI